MPSSHAAHDATRDALHLKVPVRVLAIDIDGCLVPVQHAPYELSILAEIARIHERAEHEPWVPRLTIVSGRPHGYVDAVMQLLDVTLPASFENGAGVAYREPYRFEIVPEARDALPALQEAAHRLAARPGVILQPGKVASLSVFKDPEGGQVEWVTDLVREVLDELGVDLTVDPSQDCVNVLPPGVDKELGLTRLAQTLDLPLDAFAGIGDSQGDAAWLARCGAASAPRDAHPAVERVAGHRSRLPDAGALLEFYRLLVRANRGFEPT